MNILITGSSGFIENYLIQSFRNENTTEKWKNEDPELWS